MNVGVPQSRFEIESINIDTASVFAGTKSCIDLFPLAKPPKLNIQNTNSCLAIFF